MPLEQRSETIAADPLQLTLQWRDDKLARIGLDYLTPGAVLTPAEELSAPARALAEALARYVAGEPANWPDLPLDQDEVTPFAWLTLMELKKTQPGQTLSYGRLAALCGRPKAARAIGGIMASNPWPPLIPCHRVLSADRKLTGYSAGAGLDLKAYLLRLEGAEFKPEKKKQA